MRRENLNIKRVTLIYGRSGASFEANQTSPIGSPLRVLPLALLAIIATLGAAKGATEFLWEASNERYAEQIIRKAVKSI